MFFMDTTDKKLEKETEKWLGRLEPATKNLVLSGNPAEKHFSNMNAYISDSRHFLEKRDFVRAFECAVWAWSIYELCTELGIFARK